MTSRQDGDWFYSYVLLSWKQSQKGACTAWCGMENVYPRTALLHFTRPTDVVAVGCHGWMGEARSESVHSTGASQEEEGVPDKPDNARQGTTAAEYKGSPPADRPVSSLVGLTRIRHAYPVLSPSSFQKSCWLGSNRWIKDGQNYLMLEGHVLLHELPDQVPTAPWQRLHRLIATKE